jgi:superfamily II DNA or RNA helicase/HKD family nuclease
MNNFITNSGAKNLKGRLIELIDKSDELKFLIGFFYFSGIRELYDGLKDNKDVKIKILVGLNVDKQNYGLIEYSDSEEQLSDEERCYKFFESIKKSLNTKNLDKKEFVEQIRYFIKLIQEDRLIIRKTYNPNHAKVYIFKLQKDQIGRKDLFITGSSNLTNAGLSTQEEFNVELSDYGFEDTEKYFDSLWDEAIKITENDITKKRLVEVVENETLVKEITPFEAFVLVLQTYVGSFEQKEIGESLIKTLEDNGYFPYRYQLDAVRQSLAIIEKNNGVIIADVVGLGKSVIACSVAKELKKRGIVICPPGIIGDKNKTSGWKKYIEEFGIYDWEVRSSGDLENVAKFIQKTKDIEVVIIDEVHKFRNQDTKDYEYLRNICRDKIVILLTATPFNNRPGDILSLLKLFITPKKSSITLENNLVNRFKTFKGSFERLGYIKKHWNSIETAKQKKAVAYYIGMFGEQSIDLDRVMQRSKYIARQIRDVIEPVTIRRNRLDLQGNPHYRNEIKNLSEIADPKEWFFELTKEQSDFYDKIISVYFGNPEEGGQFKGAIYRPFKYEVKKGKIKNQKLTGKENFQMVQQKQLYDFMRRLMVKRFESSFGSFRQSIKNFKNINETAQEFINKTGKYILDRDLMDNIFNKDPEEIETYLKEYSEKIKNGEYPKNHKIYILNSFQYKNEFIAHIQADIELFDKILEDLEKLDLVKNDPKTNCLINNLMITLNKKPKDGDPKRKVIIFSEYLDTVKYLKPILREHFGKRLLVIDSSLSAQKISYINKNFDASYDDQEDEFSILLSTDKISEGFNLNRAGMVINYDIPWNPVRVIQRVGRINRISKKVFKELYIVNFFPTEKGSKLVKSREIASNKMFLIHNTLGEDSKIFDINEEPTPAGLYGRVQQNPDKLEEESFYTKVINRYERIRKDNPELIEEIKKYPPRIKIAKKYTKDELLVFLKKGQLYVYSIQYNEDKKNTIRSATFEEVFSHIDCDKKENLLEFSDQAWDIYENIENFKEYRAIPVNEQSLEQKSIINLKYLINTIQYEKLIPYKGFLRTVLEDIIDYGTLSDYTLRRISNLESGSVDKNKITVKEIKEIQKGLGGLDYLQKEKDRQKDLSKEVIIAIENQKL